MCVRDDGLQVVAKVSWPSEACIRGGGGEGGQEAKKFTAAQHYVSKTGASCVSPGAPPLTHNFSLSHTLRATQRRVKDLERDQASP